MVSEKIKAKTGTFDVCSSLDPDFPGIDIEFIPGTEKNQSGEFDELTKTRPRIVFEEYEGKIRLLVWADPDSEDYSKKIEFIV